MTEVGWTAESYKLERKIFMWNKYKLCVSSFAAHFISLLFVDIIRAHSLEAGQFPEFYSERNLNYEVGILHVLDKRSIRGLWSVGQNTEARNLGYIPGFWDIVQYLYQWLWWGGKCAPSASVLMITKRATTMVKRPEHISEREWESWDWSSQERSGSGDLSKCINSLRE